MKRPLTLVLLLTTGVAPALVQPPSLTELARRSLATIDGTVTVAGLSQEVRVLRDEWGVPHIYASSTDDLFFAQGFVAAQDRLWQMEMWRRTAEGRLAEVIGPAAVTRDRHARLLKYRGAVDDAELTSYHPEARRIMTAFVNGVNAYIRDHSDRLPVEFVLTGIRPEPWSIETLILRQNSFGDATSELQLARSVAQLGAAEANRRRNPDPWEELVVPAGLDVSAIDDAVVASTGGGRGSLRPEVLPVYRALVTPAPRESDPSVREPGSNNWVVSGAMSTTGKPVVANDPHREVGNPSLRYIVHLNAPGWNAIGASEPPFLGVAIGHNERLGWGLTIVGTDQHDVLCGGDQPRQSQRGEMARRVGAVPHRPRTDCGEGRRARAHRAEVQPPWPDLPRGREAAPGVRASIGAARARHGAVSRGVAALTGERLP
jgi:penicillin amidase